jgi:hypothetical protein
VVAALNPGILGGRRAREFQTRKIEEGKRRLNLGDPESVNRSFEDYLNRPFRIVIENCLGSILLNDHVPSLTQELHIGGYGRNAQRWQTRRKRRPAGKHNHHCHHGEKALGRNSVLSSDHENSQSSAKVSLKIDPYKPLTLKGCRASKATCMLRKHGAGGGN